MSHSFSSLVSAGQFTQANATADQSVSPRFATLGELLHCRVPNMPCVAADEPCKIRQTVAKQNAFEPAFSSYNFDDLLLYLPGMGVPNEYAIPVKSRTSQNATFFKHISIVIFFLKSFCRAIPSFIQTFLVPDRFLLY